MRFGRTSSGGWGWVVLALVCGLPVGCHRPRGSLDYPDGGSGVAGAFAAPLTASIDAPTEMRIGDRRVPVSVTLTNHGDVVVDLTRLELSVAGDGAQLVRATADAGNATSVPAGGSGTAIFRIDIDPQASEGTISLTALVDGKTRDDNPGFSMVSQAASFSLKSRLNNQARFRGIRRVATAGGAVIRLDWSPAADDNTPPEELVYEVYLSATSDGFDLQAPVLTTAPGVTHVILDSGTSPLIGVGQEVYVTVRAVDKTGAVDRNETAAVVVPVTEGNVRYVSPSGTGDGTAPNSPTSSLADALAQVGAMAGGGAVLVSTGTLTIMPPVEVGSASGTQPVAIFGSFDLSGLGQSATARQLLEARAPIGGSATAIEPQIPGATLCVTGGIRAHVDGVDFRKAPPQTAYLCLEGGTLIVSGCRFLGDTAATMAQITGIELRPPATLTNTLRATGCDFLDRLGAAVTLEGRTAEVVAQGNLLEQLRFGFAALQPKSFYALASVWAPADETFALSMSDNTAEIVNSGMLRLRFLPDTVASTGASGLDLRIRRNEVRGVAVDDQLEIEAIAFSLEGFGRFSDTASGTGSAALIFEDNGVHSVVGNAVVLDLLSSSDKRVTGDVTLAFRRNRYDLIANQVIVFRHLDVLSAGHTSLLLEDEVSRSNKSDLLSITAGPHYSGTAAATGGEISILLDRVDVLNQRGHGVRIPGSGSAYLLPDGGKLSLTVRQAFVASTYEAMHAVDLQPFSSSPGSPSDLEIIWEKNTVAVANDDAFNLDLEDLYTDANVVLRVIDNTLQARKDCIDIDTGDGLVALDALVDGNSLARTGSSYWALNLDFAAPESGTGNVRVSNNRADRIDGEFLNFNVPKNQGGGGNLIATIAGNESVFTNNESITITQSHRPSHLFCLISQNTIFETNDEGIMDYTGSEGHFVIANNAILQVNDGTHEHGAIDLYNVDWLDGPYAAIIRNNIVAKSTVYGIRVGAGRRTNPVPPADLPVQIINNTLYQSGSGFSYGGIQTGATSAFSQAHVENTIVSAASGFNLGRSPLVMHGSYVLTDTIGVAAGYENLFASPSFAFEGTDRDPNFFYALFSGSSAIDAGNPAGRFDDVDGTRNDLGAFGGPGGYGVGVVTTPGLEVPFELVGTRPFLELYTGAEMIDVTSGNGDIQLFFSGEVNTSTLSAASIWVEDAAGAKVPATLAAEGQVVTLSPTAPLPTDEPLRLRVEAGGLETTAGQALTTPWYSTFAAQQASTVVSTGTSTATTTLGATGAVAATGTIEALGSDSHLYELTGVAAGDRIEARVAHALPVLGTQDFEIELLDAPAGRVLDRGSDHFGPWSGATSYRKDPYLDHTFTAAEVLASGGTVYLRVYNQTPSRIDADYRFYLVRH